MSIKDEQTTSQLEGSVERIIFRNPQNGWTVLRLARDQKKELTTVVGAFQEVFPGERVRFGGRWVENPTHGRQFKAQNCLPLAPATKVGIEKFLASGLIPGIGQVMASRMVARFGVNTLEVVENNPERLAEIEGIGRVRAAAISKTLKEKREVKNVMVFLESHGISPAYAVRIFKRFGQKAIKVVSENPYLLASEVHGIGFKMADEIAANLGIPKDSPYRAEAGILFALTEFSGEGHVFAIVDELLQRAEVLLGVDYQALESALERLVLMGHVRRYGKNNRAQIYLPKLDDAEKKTAQHLIRLLTKGNGRVLFDAQKAINTAQQSDGITFAEEQKSAFFAFAKAKVMVLTGGPGTGKTTLLKGLLKALRTSRKQVALCAPTGRAAKRMSETCGQSASTLHRLLEFTPKNGQFARNEENPLNVDVLVADELSMVDVELFASLLCAIPTDARLLLVGDPDQLPSVGPGNVLADLITIGKQIGPPFHVVRLTEIFRQAQSSLIVTGAHNILHGELPTLGQKGDGVDLFMVERPTPEGCLQVIEEMVAARIPKAFGLHPIDDIQVLAPMHKGLLGAANLNQVLQQRLNPGDGGVLVRGSTYRMGDKVMQVHNNYELDVFNGDVGKIVQIHEAEQTVRVDYGNKTVTYPVTELDQTQLAYACSIHKSQGSEYKAVVIPIHTQHFVMLQRTLLYTAITRGKQLVVLVGSRRALALAVRNNDATLRHSDLPRRINNLLT